jgi:hypothetical protein
MQQLTKVRRNIQPSAYIYARVRGARITQRGAWSQNGIFRRCSCGGMSIGGMCARCGCVVSCAWCGRVKTGREWHRVVLTSPVIIPSHGICPDDALRLRVEIQSLTVYGKAVAA